LKQTTPHPDVEPLPLLEDSVMLKGKDVLESRLKSLARWKAEEREEKATTPFRYS
jgi:hypothetical protein